MGCGDGPISQEGQDVIDKMEFERLHEECKDSYSDQLYIIQMLKQKYCEPTKSQGIFGKATGYDCGLDINGKVIK